MQGADAYAPGAPDDGVEVKTIPTGLNKKANVNFRFPQRKEKESDKRYLARVRKITAAKVVGGVLIAHKTRQRAYATYTLSGAFTEELAIRYCTRILAARRSKNKSTQKEIRMNIGAWPCKTCLHIHRLDAFVAASDTFDHVKGNVSDAFWVNLLDKEHTAQCAKTVTGDQDTRNASDADSDGSGESDYETASA